MRVALIAPYPQAPGRPSGGVEAAAEILAGALAQRGAVIRVFDPFTGYPDGEATKNPSVIRLNALRPWRAASPTIPRDLRLALDAWRPDVVHVHLGTQFARIRSASVVTIHGFPHLESALRNPGVAGRLRSVPLRKQFYQGLRSSRAVIAISDEAAQVAREVGVPVFSIPNPIAPVFFSLPRQASRDFLAVGNIMRRKNQLHLMNAFRIFVESGGEGDLVVAGEVQDATYFEHCVAACGPAISRVHFVGPQPREEVARLLATSRACVSASLRETSSIATSEALAANCPVVCLDAGTVRMQVPDERFGRVLPIGSSPREFARALQDLPRQVSDGQPLRDSVRDQHPVAVADATIKVYEWATA